MTLSSSDTNSSDIRHVSSAMFETRLLARDIFNKFGGKITFLLTLALANTFMEGLGVVMLLPLLSHIGIGEMGRSTAGNFINQMFEAVGFNPGLYEVLAVTLGIFILQYGVFVWQNYWSNLLNFKYTERWRVDLMRAYLNAGWPYFTRNPASKLSNSLISEIERLGGAFTTLNDSVVAILVALGYGILAMLISWEMTLAFLIGTLLIATVTWSLMKSSFNIGSQITQTNEEFHFASNEIISNAKYIKSSASEEFSIKQFQDIIARLRHFVFLGNFLPKVLRAVIELFTISFLLLLLVLGVRNFDIPAEEILVMAALCIRLYPRISGVQVNLKQLHVYLPAIGTVRRSLESAREAAEPLDDSPLPASLKKGNLRIDIDGLTLNYDSHRVLNRVSLGIEPGMTVGIVGPSGAGKSTLVDCLLGLVDWQDGGIRVNNIALGDLPLSSWRKAVGYVGQETFLFHTSILNNIAWGKADATPEEVKEAARKAHALDFISRAPQGLETIIGDRGLRLSGGERQRIRLAQALLQNPLMLILDEATSALDSQSEKAVLEAIQELKGEITIVMVAHRLSTVRHADRIFVLDRGEVVETGTFDELVTIQGRFADMWRLQQTGTT